MALKDLMARLIPRADTPDTCAKSMGYQRKAPIHAGCTSDTPDTPCFVDARAIVQTRQLGEAVNDPANAQPPGLALPAAPELDSPASAPPAMLAKPPKQTFIEWQDTWLALDQAYQRHYFNCPTCIAAGLGYGLRCGAGAAL